MRDNVRPPPYPADTRAKGWRFEVDIEKVKASDTWLRAKSGALRGALLLLWSEAWQQTPCGTLPNDDELVALLIDMPASTFAKSKSVLMRGWWLANNGRLYHDTITTRVLAMLDKRAKDAGRTAARRGRAADTQATHAEVTRDAHVTHAGVTPEFDTKHQAPSTTEAKASVAPKRRAVKKCPDDFTVTPSMLSFADEKAPGLDVDRETLKFRNHEFKTARSDWPATWRNWMLEAFDRKPKQPAQGMTYRERDTEAKRATVDAWTGAARAKDQNTIDMEAPNGTLTLVG